MNGTEWLVEARGGDPARLADQRVLEDIFNQIIGDLDLHVVGSPVWHTFPHPGGVTGLCLLSESHLTVHTFPEHGSACFNLFCCTPRAEWPFAQRLRESLGATNVSVRRVTREYSGQPVIARAK